MLRSTDGNDAVGDDAGSGGGGHQVGGLQLPVPMERNLWPEDDVDSVTSGSVSPRSSDEEDAEQRLTFDGSRWRLLTQVSKQTGDVGNGGTWRGATGRLQNRGSPFLQRELWRRIARSYSSGGQPGEANNFSIFVVTMSGETHRMEDVQPEEDLWSLRNRIAVNVGLNVSVLHLCHGSLPLKPASDTMTLSSLAITEGSVLTAIRAQGTPLGSGRYALTSRRLSFSDSADDVLVAIRAEFGSAAVLADFESIGHFARGDLSRFMDEIGLHGGALVLDRGRVNYGDHRGGHFFACRHSCNIPPSWLVRPLPLLEEDYGINCLDLCWKNGGLMPALVDLGPL